MKESIWGRGRAGEFVCVVKESSSSLLLLQFLVANPQPKSSLSLSNSNGLCTSLHFITCKDPLLRGQYGSSLIMTPTLSSSPFSPLTFSFFSILPLNYFISNSPLHTFLMYRKLRQSELSITVNYNEHVLHFCDCCSEEKNIKMV